MGNSIDVRLDRNGCETIKYTPSPNWYGVMTRNGIRYAPIAGNKLGHYLLKRINPNGTTLSSTDTWYIKQELFNRIMKEGRK